jgi:hypothetical protein
MMLDGNKAGVRKLIKTENWALKDTLRHVYESLGYQPRTHNLKELI